MGNITIQDVFEQFIPMIADRSFSDEQFNAIKCIRSCRTAETIRTMQLVGAKSANPVMLSLYITTHARTGIVLCVRQWKLMSG